MPFLVVSEHNERGDAVVVNTNIISSLHYTPPSTDQERDATLVLTFRKGQSLAGATEHVIKGMMAWRVWRFLNEKGMMLDGRVHSPTSVARAAEIAAAERKPSPPGPGPWGTSY
jgi:hypothetical protein